MKTQLKQMTHGSETELIRELKILTFLYEQCTRIFPITWSNLERLWKKENRTKII